MSSNVAVTDDAVLVRMSHKQAEDLMAAAGYTPCEWAGDRVIQWEGAGQGTRGSIEELFEDALQTVSEALQ